MDNNKKIGVFFASVTGGSILADLKGSRGCF
jgi:hypothetical protein